VHVCVHVWVVGCVRGGVQRYTNVFRTSPACTCVCVCLCVCTCERENECGCGCGCGCGCVGVDVIMCLCVCIHTHRSEEQLLAFWRAATVFSYTTGTHSQKRSHTPGTLQHTTTHCIILQHTTTHCNTLHHTAIHCNTLQHTETYSMTKGSYKNRACTK